MRLVALLLVAAVLGAGCLSSAGTLDPGSSDGDGDGSATPPPDEEKTFCEQEEGCAFWDDDYHEYALYRVDSMVLDVLIVPSASADGAEDTRVIKAAVDAWARGIQELGAPWFAGSFRINAYVLGEDAPPAEALQDPEIVVLAAEYNPAVLFGIGAEPKQMACESLGQETRRAYPAHAHDGMEVRASDCTGIGFTCFAVNTNFLMGDAIHLQDLVAHEFGHCLGGGHVGDALDFKAKRVPVEDIMSYQHNDAQAHCVSNLNVRVLEALYAPVAGEAVETPVEPGHFLAMPRAEYRQVACAVGG